VCLSGSALCGAGCLAVWAAVNFKGDLGTSQGCGFRWVCGIGWGIGDVLLLRDLWSGASEVEGVELSGDGLTSSINNLHRLFW